MNQRNKQSFEGQISTRISDTKCFLICFLILCGEFFAKNCVRMKNFPGVELNSQI